MKIVTDRSLHGYQFLVAVFISALLMFSDWKFSQVDVVRQGLETVISPIRWLVALPFEIDQWSDTALASRSELTDENRELAAELLILQGRLQKMNSLELDNQRMRSLLNASYSFGESIRAAEITAIDSDPFTHHMIINSGLSDGVYVGQAVIDANGVMGQIIEASTFSSRLLLIADSNHATPVQINRNGVRAILVGNGSLSHLDLYHVQTTADVQVGDLLVTSGLGEKFPPGYPVGKVESVESPEGEAFARIKVSPLAKLDRSRYILLLNARNKQQNETGEENE